MSKKLLKLQFGCIRKMRFHFIFIFIITTSVSCEKNEEITPIEEILFSDNILNINSVIIKDDSLILVDGLKYGNIYLTLIDKNMKEIHHATTKFTWLDRIYHPFPNIEVILKSGDYTDSPVGVYFSTDYGKTFQSDYLFDPEWGDWWLGYIPINEESYFLHAGSNWDETKTVKIDNGIQVSDFQVVLKGYSILQGFIDKGKIHVIANEVTNTQPTNSDNIFYFSSVDMGQNWGEKYSFGEIGHEKLKFLKTQDNTLVLHSPFKNYDFKSIDKGATWQKTEYPIELSDVTYFNKSNGYAIADSILHETNDGGHTWKHKSNLTYKLSYLNFINESIGVIYADTLIGYTSNNGINWKYITKTPK